MVTSTSPSVINSPALSVRDLSIEFRTGSRTVRAVNHASFEVGRGEILGVVGESGSGKSATMWSVMGILAQPPAEIVGGSIDFLGRELLGLPEAEWRKLRGNEMAMVFQDPMTTLNPALTIEQQVTEGLEIHRSVSRRQARERCIELLGLVGIDEPSKRMYSYPHEFSGGMRQRVVIAMALVCEPKLLIADEPTTALDVTTQAQLLRLFLRLRDELGMSMIIVTHNLGVVAEIADRVSVMYGGTVVESATTNVLFESPKHPYTIGLLNSMPALGSGKSRLEAIPGSPPDQSRLHEGCRFYDRCKFHIDICRTQEPELLPSGDSLSRCWLTMDGTPP